MGKGNLSGYIGLNNQVELNQSWDVSQAVGGFPLLLGRGVGLLRVGEPAFEITDKSMLALI